VRLGECAHTDSIIDSQHVHLASIDCSQGRRKTAVSLLHVFSNSTTRIVDNVRWVSDRPSVLIVGLNGEARALAVGSATLTAQTSDEQVQSIIAVVQDIAGRRNGQFQVTSCSRLSGPGSSPGRFVEGAILPITLDILQEHDVINGTLAMFSDPTASGRVTGTQSETERAILNGTLVGDPGETYDIADWTSTIGENADIAGTFVLNVHFGNSFGTQSLVYRCPIVSLRMT